MSKKRITVVVRECCGGICSRVLVNDYSVSFANIHSDDGDYQAWADGGWGEDAQIAKWKAMLKTLLEALRRAVENGEITQKQADAALEQWLKENPNPDPETNVPPEKNIDVTEEYEKIRRRVVVPATKEE